jgi:hypothetical protein
MAKVGRQKADEVRVAKRLSRRSGAGLNQAKFSAFSIQFSAKADFGKGNASGVTHDVAIDEPRSPFGRRSGLLQKNHHFPLQEGPLRPDRAKPPAMIRHRREPSRSLSRGAEPRRRRGSIPAPQIREQRHRNKPPAFKKRFCLLLPRMAKVGRPPASAKRGAKRVRAVRRGFQVSCVRFQDQTVNCDAG